MLRESLQLFWVKQGTLGKNSWLFSFVSLSAPAGGVKAILFSLCSGNLSNSQCEFPAFWKYLDSVLLTDICKNKIQAADDSRRVSAVFLSH